MGKKRHTKQGKHYALIIYSVNDRETISYLRYRSAEGAAYSMEYKLREMTDYNATQSIEYNANKTKATVLLGNGKHYTFEIVKLMHGKFYPCDDIFLNEDKYNKIVKEQGFDVKKDKDKRKYNRIARFSVGDVRSMYEHYKDVGENTLFLYKHNDSYKFCEIDMSDDRYANFFEHGITCVKCGIKGKYFWLETLGYGKDNPYAKPHFNLYGRSEMGEEIMLTKDHVVAKSKDGEDKLDNYVCMCAPCNQKKSSMDYDEFMKR